MLVFPFLLAPCPAMYWPLSGGIPGGARGMWRTFGLGPPWVCCYHVWTAETPLTHALEHSNLQMKRCFWLPVARQPLIILSQIFCVQRIAICDLTGSHIHTRPAGMATEESQEFPHQPLVFRNKGPWRPWLIPRQSPGRCERFTCPRGPRL